MDNYGKPQWFETHSNIKFNPLNPKVEDIKIEDIAHSLSYTARAGGHFKIFYSVAQHSVACLLESREWTLDWDEKLRIQLERLVLMHDASEAYIGDMPSPAKAMMPEYKKIEDNIQRVICEKFNIQYDKESAIYKFLKEIDIAMTAYESKHLFEHNLKHWDTSYSYLVQQNREIPHIKLQEIPFREGKEQFLYHFNELFPEFSTKGE